MLICSLEKEKKKAGIGEGEEYVRTISIPIKIATPQTVVLFY